MFDHMCLCFEVCIETCVKWSVIGITRGEIGSSWSVLKPIFALN